MKTMKTKLTLLALAACALSLLSCDKNDALQAPEQILEVVDTRTDVTFKVTAPQPATATKAATEGVTRYIMEVWTDADATTPENCFGKDDTKTNRSVVTNGKFVANLDKTVDYTILFWADDADAETYNITSLKAVKLADSKTMTEHAYFAKMTGKIEVTQGITLKRAVAQIKFVQVGNYIDLLNNGKKTVKITYEKTYSFNALTATVNAPEEPSRTRTFPATIMTDGKIYGSDYHFATTTAAENTLIKLTINVVEEDLAGIVVDLMPVAANKITKLQGQYSANMIQTSGFTITSVDEWGSTEENIDFVELGNPSMPYTITAPKAGATQNVSFNATESWTVASDATAWCTVSAASGTTTGAVMFSITTTDNTSESSSLRTTIVTVTSGSKVSKITVTQPAL